MAKQRKWTREASPAFEPDEEFWRAMNVDGPAVEAIKAATHPKMPIPTQKWCDDMLEAIGQAVRQNATPAIIYRAVLLGARASDSSRRLAEMEKRTTDTLSEGRRYSSHGGRVNYEAHIAEWRAHYASLPGDWSNRKKCMEIAKKTPHRNLIKEPRAGELQRFTWEGVSKALKNTCENSDAGPAL